MLTQTRVIIYLTKRAKPAKLEAWNENPVAFRKPSYTSPIRSTAGSTLWRGAGRMASSAQRAAALM